VTDVKDDRYLVTGALGCIGAWTVRSLVADGVPVVAFDLGRDPRRLRSIMTPDELARVTFVAGDVTELAGVERALDEHDITNVIHLAALQVPFCRADPLLGAQINVVGTVTMFEAVRRRVDRMGPLVYTSSIGMFGADDVDARTGRLDERSEAHPTTHYGVYKLANEGTARVYAMESGVSSVGIRPLTVYGVGRDQGMTSSPTIAIAAAVMGVRYTISFGGRTLFQYAPDVAATLIAAARSRLSGARMFNLGGTVVELADWIDAIEAEVPSSRGSLSISGDDLPFPTDIEQDGVAALGEIPITPYRTGIRATADIYRSLAAEGLLIPEEHGLSLPG